MAGNFLEAVRKVGAVHIGKINSPADGSKASPEKYRRPQHLPSAAPFGVTRADFSDNLQVSPDP
jgi:hypothetical protein